jgi:hypothetical protein
VLAPTVAALGIPAVSDVVGTEAAVSANVLARRDGPEQIFDGNPGTTAPSVQATYGGIHKDAVHADMWKPSLASFRWQLMGDTTARALFHPAGTCGICQDAKWTGRSLQALSIPVRKQTTEAGWRTPEVTGPQRDLARSAAQRLLD